MTSQPSGLQLAVLCTRQEPGDAAACISIGKVPIPRARDGEALVKMLLRPINPADLKSLQGSFAGFAPERFPAVPGIEGVGRIVEPCSKFSVGQRVVSTAWPLRSGQGTWQEFCVAPLEHLYAVPDRLSDQQAAIFWSNPVTAVGLLRVSAVPKGEWLMLTAANSSIGRQIIQIGKSYSLKLIAIVRRSEDRPELLRLGADVVISTAEDNLKERVAEVTNGKGAYACLDAVGGEQCQSLMHCLRAGGTLHVYGGLAGPTLTAGIKDIVYSSQVIKGFRMTPWFMSHDKAGQTAIVQEVFRLLQHVIEPFHGRVFPLQEAVEAVRAAQQPQQKAKILLSSSMTSETSH